MSKENKKIKRLVKILKSNKSRGFIDEIGFYNGPEYVTKYTHILKVESNQLGVQLIYKYNSESKESIDLYEDLRFEGIYNYLTKEFYVAEFYFSYLSLMEDSKDEINVDGVKVTVIDNLASVYNKKFKNVLISEIGTDKSKVEVPLSNESLNDLLSEAKNKALDLFMDNKELSDIDIHYYHKLYGASIVSISKDLYVRFLSDPEDTLKEELECFLKEKRHKIYFQMLKTEEILSEMEKLEEDGDKTKLKELLSVLNDNSRKTLNVLLEKDGNEALCRIRTGRYSHHDKLSFKNNYISEFDIVGTEKSEQIEDFKDVFGVGYNNYAYFENIKEITYSRRVLYSRDD